MRYVMFVTSGLVDCPNKQTKFSNDLCFLFVSDLCFFTVLMTAWLIYSDIANSKKACPSGSVNSNL